MTGLFIPGDLLERTNVIAGLRLLADYLEDHPDIPVAPLGWDLSTYALHGDETQRRADVDKIAAALGVPVDDDTGHGGHYTAARTFGLITYRAVCVPDRRRDAYNALMSYAGCVTPDPGPEVTP